MTTEKTIDRFTKDIADLIFQVNGINITIDKSKSVSKPYLIEIMELAASNATRIAFDLPIHAKNLAYTSNSRLSIKDSRVIIKGLLGYKKENDPDQTGYDKSDIEKVRYIAIKNSRKYLLFIDALKKWK